MREVLQRHGLDPDADVNVVGLGPRYPAVVDLFRSGELAGAVLSEPNVSIGEGAGAFRVMQALTDEAYCPDMQWGLVVAGPDTIAREPELIRAVLRASRRSYRYAAEHPDEWVAFGARHFGITRETMKRSIEREIAGLHFDGEIDMRRAAAGDRPAGAARRDREAAAGRGHRRPAVPAAHLRLRVP